MARRTSLRRNDSDTGTIFPIGTAVSCVNNKTHELIEGIFDAVSKAGNHIKILVNGKVRWLLISNWIITAE